MIEFSLKSREEQRIRLPYYYILHALTIIGFVATSKYTVWRSWSTKSFHSRLRLRKMHPFTALVISRWHVAYLSSSRQGSRVVLPSGLWFIGILALGARPSVSLIHYRYTSRVIFRSVIPPDLLGASRRQNARMRLVHIVSRTVLPPLIRERTLVDSRSLALIEILRCVICYVIIMLQLRPRNDVANAFGETRR